MHSKIFLLELLGLVIGTLILVACVPENANNVDSYYQKEYKYNEVKDSVDGQKYRAIQIGNQYWIVQNINRETSKSVCDSCEIYGRIYNYEEAKNVCPSGFTLPTYADVEELIKNTKEVNAWQSKKGWMKKGKDSFGFASIPGGFYSRADGIVKKRGEMVGYWLQDESDDFALRWKISNQDSFVDVSALKKDYGFSVRCISVGSSIQNNLVLIDERDLKFYKTIAIGTQTWMAENLKYKIKESSCSKGEIDKCENEGRLYRFWEAKKEKICPKGWKIPSVGDWNKFFSFANMRRKCESFGYEYEFGNECDYYVWNTANEKIKKIGLSGNYATTGLTYFNRKGVEFDSHYCFHESSDGITASDYCCQDVCEDYVRCIKK